MKLPFALAALAGASVAGAAGATITVTHELDAARPGGNRRRALRADRQRSRPALRMYHVVVRDPKGRALPLQITNYQHDHRGAQYDDLVFSYDFAAGEKRADVHARSRGHRHAARCALRVRAHGSRALRRHGLGERSHRASHVRLRAEHARPRGGERLRGSGIDVWAQARHATRSSIAGTPRDTTSSTRTKKAKASTSTASAARAARAARASGTARSSGPPTISSMRQVLSNGPRRAAFKLTYAPWDAGAHGQVAETKQFTVDCGRNFDAVESVFDFAGDDAVVGIGITEHPAARRFSRGGADARPARPLDELLGREQGRRAGRRGDPRRLTRHRPASRTRMRPAKHPATQSPAAGEGARTACRCVISPAPAGRRAGSSTDRAAWETLREGVRGARGRSR